MSDQDFTTRPEGGDADEALSLDPNFTFDRSDGEAAAEEAGEPVEGVQPHATVLEPSMTSSPRDDSPADEDPAPEAQISAAEAPEDPADDAGSSAPDTPPAPAGEAAPNAELAESLWAAVRDRGLHPTNDAAPAEEEPSVEEERPLTGEEVELPGEITPADDIVGESAPVVTGQIEPVTLGPHTTTIPVMTGEVPVMTRIDPTPTPRDVLAHRGDAEALDSESAATAEEAPSPVEPLDETSLRRRSLVSPSIAPEEPAPEASWLPREEAVEQGAEQVITPATPRSLDDTIFEGATVQAEVPSRTGSHWASLLLHLLLLPAAWFLLADAGARLTLNDAGSVATGGFSPIAVGELAGGILLVLVLFLLARKSSLGPWFSGVLTTLVGLPWLVVPGLTGQFLLPHLRWLSSSSALGQNLSHHLQASGYSGRLLLAGFVLMGVGALSHSVRRIGRDEEALRAEVEKINPAGAHFTARARRRAAQAAGLR